MSAGRTSCSPPTNQSAPSGATGMLCTSHSYSCALLLTNIQVRLVQLGLAGQAVHPRCQRWVGITVVWAGQEDGWARLARLAGGPACEGDRRPRAASTLSCGRRYTSGQASLCVAIRQQGSATARVQQCWLPTVLSPLQQQRYLAVPSPPAVGEVMFHRPRTYW